MTLPGTVEPHDDLYWTFQIIGPPDPEDKAGQHNAQSKREHKLSRLFNLSPELVNAIRDIVENWDSGHPDADLAGAVNMARELVEELE
jgi:hypothetical protein